MTPASGGEDPESLDRARDNAPLTMLTLGRAVSVQDYTDFARSFAGIDKAQATWAASGTARGIFVTVAGPDGAAVADASETMVNLAGALRNYGDPLVPADAAVLQLRCRSRCRPRSRSPTMRTRTPCCADVDAALR